MKAINASILEQLSASNMIPFYTISFTVNGTTYYFTDCDVPITIGGTRYLSRPFTLGDIVDSSDTYTQELDVSLVHLDSGQLPDTRSTLYEAILGTSPQGNSFQASLVVLDTTTYAVVGSTFFPLFYGTISAWNMDETMLNMNIQGLLYQFTQRTISQHPPSCRWKIFKGTECGYVGAATACDRSATQCYYTFNNFANFGGFRWLPTLENKVIVWGADE
jgi:hypothetical protein